MEHASCDDSSDVKRAGYIEEEEKEETERVSIGSRSLAGTVGIHAWDTKINHLSIASDCLHSRSHLLFQLNPLHQVHHSTIRVYQPGHRLIRLHPISLQVSRSH